MDKLNEVKKLVQKLRDTKITVDDLSNLQIDPIRKQEIVDEFNIELNRVLYIMDKIDSGNTMHQGGNN